MNTKFHNFLNTIFLFFMMGVMIVIYYVLIIGIDPDISNSYIMFLVYGIIPLVCIPLLFILIDKNRNKNQLTSKLESPDIYKNEVVNSKQESTNESVVQLHQNQEDQKPASEKDIVIILVVVFALMYGYVKLTGYGSEGQSPSKPAPARNITSYVACQMAVENAALDKSEVDVPVIKGQKRSDGSWEYYWGSSTQPLRMPNKFGQSLIVEGKCVATEDGRVTSLILDGKTIRKLVFLTIYQVAFFNHFA